MPYAFATHPDPLEILRVPGYLFWNPTSLVNEAGLGTKLGFCERGVQVQIEYGIATATDEEHGQEPRIAVFAGTRVSVQALLKNYNAVAMATLFPGLTSGTALSVPGGILPGKRLDTAYGDNLLFVPEDSTNNPIFLLQRALPHFKGTLSLSRQTDTIFPCFFEGFRAAENTDGLYYLGMIGGGVIR